MNPIRLITMLAALDDRFHETGLDEANLDEAASMELELCWWIPRLGRSERGTATWQRGGKRLRW
jgi:hypothetical protein